MCARMSHVDEIEIQIQIETLDSDSLSRARCPVLSTVVSPASKRQRLNERVASQLSSHSTGEWRRQAEPAVALETGN